MNSGLSVSTDLSKVMENSRDLFGLDTEALVHWL